MPVSTTNNKEKRTPISADVTFMESIVHSYLALVTILVSKVSKETLVFVQIAPLFIRFDEVIFAYPVSVSGSKGLLSVAIVMRVVTVGSVIVGHRMDVRAMGV